MLVGLTPLTVPSFLPLLVDGKCNCNSNCGLIPQ